MSFSGQESESTEVVYYTDHAGSDSHYLSSRSRLLSSQSKGSSGQSSKFTGSSYQSKNFSGQSNQSMDSPAQSNKSMGPSGQSTESLGYSLRSSESMGYPSTLSTCQTSQSKTSSFDVGFCGHYMVPCFDTCPHYLKNGTTITYLSTQPAKTKSQSSLDHSCLDTVNSDMSFLSTEINGEHQYEYTHPIGEVSFRFSSLDSDIVMLL